MDGSAPASATGLSAAEAIAVDDLSGKAGEVARLAALHPGRTILADPARVGDESPAELRRAGAALARQLERGQRAVAVLPSAATRADAERVYLGPAAGRLHASSMRDGGPDPVSPRAVRLLVPDEGDPAPAAARSRPPWRWPAT